MRNPRPEGIALFKGLHRNLAATETVARACACGTPEKPKRVNWKILLVEHFQKFLTDSSAGPNDGNIH